MGCCGSKTVDGRPGTGADSNSGPVITNVGGSSKPTPGGIPIQSKPNNPYSVGIGVATSPPARGEYPDSEGVANSSDLVNSLGAVGGKIYLARYAYQARTTEDLSFEKGERLVVVGNQDSDWWLAKSVKSQREGYIPKNYVAEAESYEAEE